MTNKDMIKSILDDTNKLVDFLLESPCEHCYFWQDNHCNCPDVDNYMVDLCVEGVLKWLNSDVGETARESTESVSVAKDNTNEALKEHIKAISRYCRSRADCDECCLTTLNGYYCFPNWKSPCHWEKDIDGVLKEHEQ